MTFQEIFNEDGRYVTDGFKEGFCFIIESGFLYGLQYKNKNDIQPEFSTHPVYKSLFKKEYKKVYTRQSLFE